jgi:hypothetical protein
MNSCAEPDTVSAAANTTAIVIRITLLASSLRYIHLSLSDMNCSAATEATSQYIKKDHFTTTIFGVCQRCTFMFSNFCMD